MNEKGLTLIKRFKLKNLDNKLYIGFLRDVNHFIVVKTPIALGISNCYENFRQRLEVANNSRQPRSKHPLTAELAKQHARRQACFRCLKGHVRADIDNDDPALREHARILNDKIESYGDMLHVARTTFTARAADLGRDLSAEPLAEHVAKLGQTANVLALIAANNAYTGLVSKRRNSKKNFVPNAFRDARIALDKAYRELVAAVNAQIIASQMLDGPIASDITVLEDFAKIINGLIQDYRTTAKQSGPDKKKDADDTDDADSKP